jgi:DNA polymerase III epsilon subunit-like protein
MTPKPYIAVDIETTGLMEYDQILQIAMVYDDLKSPVESLETHSFLIDNSTEEFHGVLDAYAISMNAWIFKELSRATKSNHLIYPIVQARQIFHDKILKWHNQTKEALTFAGKNVANFDLPALRRWRFLTPLNNQYISHRVIDTGSLYFTDFGYIPSQNEINQKIGRKPASHDALDDALDVVCAIRTKLGVVPSEA